MSERGEQGPHDGASLDRVDALLETCIDRPRSEWQATLEALCVEHAELANELRRRFRRLESLGISAAPPGGILDAAIPTRIGRYRIIELLGTGGMGTVYLADQDEPVRRRVALKLMRTQLVGEQARARFGLERQALAVMSHPFIAHVFDADTTPEGLPYFVMEYVEGVPLGTFCERHDLGLEERIRLFQRICDAVQHAHHKGVIHRDLKPGNILVSLEGDDAVPKVIDFGLARAIEQPLLEEGPFTEHGQVLGTLEYMSPEQACASEQDAVDTRTDVYSLGVILYELLSGALPFASAGLRKAGLAEIQRKLWEDEPPKPSTRVSETREDIDGSRPSSTASTCTPKALRGDLDWIVMKAIEKDPDRRYGTPTALAADLARFLTHEPVEAGPPGFGYRLRKLVRKYRVQVGALAGIALALAIGLAVAIWQSLEIDALSEAERNERARARTVVRLRAARAALDDTYPSWPERLGSIRAWRRDYAEPLIAYRPELQKTLRRIEQRAVQRGAEGDDWQFESLEDGFVHEMLSDLIAEIVEIETVVVADSHEREAWAQRILELTLRHPKAPTSWDEARRAIRLADGTEASRMYASDPPLELTPQIGLVPIGMNPVTKLWEFYHLRSAWEPRSGEDPGDIEIPTHDEAGRIAVAEDTGIVFVLLPGGTFTMGAQRVDPSEETGKNFDPQAHPSAGPPHGVELSPFFLARHEMTQGQWQRLTGGANPSHWTNAKTGADIFTLAHPVELVTWHDCEQSFFEHGLTLPTEAQWEYGCRAGTSTPWWPGDEAMSLAGTANIADRTFLRFDPDHAAGLAAPDFDDGWQVHAPVGSYRANAFGLHDVHGNVFEWCRDARRQGDYRDLRPRAGDGLRSGDGPLRVYRGGGYAEAPGSVRSAKRYAQAPQTEFPDIGVRAARALRLQ